MLNTKTLTLEITYDEARVGDPSLEWDWYNLLHLETGEHVKLVTFAKADEAAAEDVRNALQLLTMPPGEAKETKAKLVALLRQAVVKLEQK